jgi:hypothetical protein
VNGVNGVLFNCLHIVLAKGGGGGGGMSDSDEGRATLGKGGRRGAS